MSLPISIPWKLFHTSFQHLLLVIHSGRVKPEGIRSQMLDKKKKQKQKQTIIPVQLTREEAKANPHVHIQSLDVHSLPSQGSWLFHKCKKAVAGPLSANPPCTPKKLDVNENWVPRMPKTDRDGCMVFLMKSCSSNTHLAGIPTCWIFTLEAEDLQLQW